MAKLFAGYEEDFKKAFRPVEARFSKQEAIDLQPIMNSFKTGFSLRDQSRWADAAKVFESVITTYEEGLGREHDLIVSARGHLAGLYVELERYQEAGGLFTICENISITKLGPTHPVTLQYSNSLFQVLINLRRTADARDKGESLLRTLVETQSNDNYQTLGVLLRLGSVYVNLSDYKTALDYHERALEGMERTVGFNNIDTIYTQFKLGALYAELGDMGKAANIYQQNRDICASTRGITNEAYLRAAVNLGSVQRLGGQDVEAEKTLRALLPPTGPDRKHPYWEKYIGRAANELIMLYKRLGRHDDVHKVQAWMDGDAQALLEVEKTDATHAHWSPRVGEDEEVFDWDVKIANSKGDWDKAVVLLDTACQTGNWIALRVVARLGKLGSVSQEFDAPGAVDANQQPVTAAGVIELQWKRSKRGNRLFHTKFFVFADISQFDVLLGAEYILEEKLLTVSQDAMAPLVEHEKIKKGDKAAIALEKQKQRQQKEELERRRRATAAQQSSSQPQQQGQGP